MLKKIVITIIIISAVIALQACYRYSNPYDTLADPSMLDVSSVTFTAVAGESITIDWADVAEAVSDQSYLVKASETLEGLGLEEGVQCWDSVLDIPGDAWRADEWIHWKEIYFRIGYRIDGSISGSGLPVWSGVFHAPLCGNSPISGGVEITTLPELDWDDMEGVSAYSIEYAKSAGGLSGNATANTGDSESSYWTGFTINTGDTIYWRIRVNGRSDGADVTELWGGVNSFTVKAAPEVGDLYGGGYVFYVDGSNGLTITDAAVAEEISWGPAGTDIAGDNSGVAPELTAIGDGQANTTAIITELGSDTAISVAGICNNLVYRGFDDWYLPSIGELTEMKAAFGWELLGIDDVQLGRGFWSSSEYDADNVYVRHNDGEFARYKEGLHDLFAVRSFSY